MPAKKFVSKPVQIEAMQYLEGNKEEVIKWMHESSIARRSWDPVNLFIKSEHGILVAAPGDWVIKGSRGEFYPCANSTFQEKYKPTDIEQPTGAANARRT